MVQLSLGTGTVLSVVVGGTTVKASLRRSRIAWVSWHILDQDVGFEVGIDYLGIRCMFGWYPIVFADLLSIGWDCDVNYAPDREAFLGNVGVLLRLWKLAYVKEPWLKLVIKSLHFWREMKLTNIFGCNLSSSNK
jgi:hypothetical protein